MPKPKICLTTYFDKNFEKVGELCLKSIKKYAARHGYNFEVFGENEIKSDRPASWNKILVIQKLLEKDYDFIFWIDADAIFIRYDKDIAEEIEHNKDLYLVSIQVGRGEAPGLGVFLIKNNDWSKDILKKIWGMEEYKFHVGWENGALVDYLGLVGYIAKEDRERFWASTKLNKPNFELLERVKWLDQRWHHWHWLTPKIKDPIINHYAVAPYKLRLFLMTKDAYKTSLIRLTTFIKICVTIVVPFLV